MGPVALAHAGNDTVGPATGAALDAVPNREAKRVGVFHGARHKVSRDLRGMGVPSRGKNQIRTKSGFVAGARGAAA